MKSIKNLEEFRTIVSLEIVLIIGISLLLYNSVYQLLVIDSQTLDRQVSWRIESRNTQLDQLK